MTKDPCTTCLVRPCCRTRKNVYYNCGCDPYEIYKTYQNLFRYCDHNEKLTQLMMDENPRIKKIYLRTNY